MNIHLTLLSLDDADALFAFERENRDFFESQLPPRPDDYYERERFDEIMNYLMDEHEKGTRSMYLVKDDGGEILGRVNFFGIMRGPFQKAEIGYRLGERHVGKGIGRQMVARALEIASETLGLQRVEAGTDVENIPSQIVLMKNGFRFVGTAHRFIHVNGRWRDCYYFERLLPLDTSSDA